MEPATAQKDGRSAETSSYWKPQEYSAEVDGHLVTLRYYDTHGQKPPKSGVNTTVIAVHGVGNNSDVWRLLPQHFSSDIRFFAYNQRGYAGSSPIVTSSSEDVGLQKCTGQYLLDFLRFIRFVAENTSSERIVVLAWSKGCAVPLSLLILLSSLSEPSLPFDLTYALVSPFLPLLRASLYGIILFEPPGSTIGAPPTPDLLDLLKEASLAIGLREMILRGGDPPLSKEREEEAEMLDVFYSAQEDENVPHSFAWKLGRDNEEILARTSRVFQSQSAHLPPSYRTGLIHGTNTSLYFIDSQKRFKEVGSTRIEFVKSIEGAYHIGMITHSEVFAELIEVFVVGM